MVPISRCYLIPFCEADSNGTKLELWSENGGVSGLAWLKCWLDPFTDIYGDFCAMFVVDLQRDSRSSRSILILCMAFVASLCKTDNSSGKRISSTRC